MTACPHCTTPLTEAEVLALYGAAMSARRTRRKGWPAGSARGPRDATAPRCPCGAMTLKRADARGHKCTV